MKKINVLLCTLAVAGLGFTSCSDDDSNGNNNNNNEVTIAGTYNLKEVNTENSTDFNKDGTSNINQMKESDCYNASKIIFNADNTFTYDKNGIIVNENDATFGCTENDISGRWEIYAGTGANVVIRGFYKDGNGTDKTMQFTKQGKEVSIYELFSQYPDRNTEGGAIYTTGDVEYIFEK